MADGGCWPGQVVGRYGVLEVCREVSQRRLGGGRERENEHSHFYTEKELIMLTAYVERLVRGD